MKIEADEILGQRIASIRAQIAVAKATFNDGLKGLEMALQDLDGIADQALLTRIGDLPKPSIPATEHRRQHRSSRIAKLD